VTLKRKVIIPLALVLKIGKSHAQTNDFCAWFDADAVKRIRAISIGLSGQFCTMNNSSEIYRT